MAKLLGFIRPLIRPVFNPVVKSAISPASSSIVSPRRKRMAPAPFASAATSVCQPRQPRQSLRIYRDPSHIVMVGSIHEICRKLDQAVAERYCHIEG